MRNSKEKVNTVYFLLKIKMISMVLVRSIRLLMRGGKTVFFMPRRFGMMWTKS
jgi:hypothetical protein